MAKLKIKKGDTVLIIAGNHKGKRGKVLEVIPSENKAIVEGYNLVSKHQKPSAQSPDGGIVKTEAPMSISNLMFVDPSSGEPTRIGRQLNDEGNIVRYSKKSGQVI